MNVEQKQREEVHTYKQSKAGGDAHWLPLEQVSPMNANQYSSYSLKGYYVEMPDGVRLAVDVFLPQPSQDGAQFRTALHFTRYNRNWEFKPCAAMSCSILCCCCMCGTASKGLKIGQGFPGTKGSHWNMRSVIFAEQFLPAGYAWVTVDVRGTGASQGSRGVDLHPVELEDAKYIAEWVLQQPWCGGDLFSTGISYDGISALVLASHQIDATRAIAPLFAPFDLMDEISHPGGVRCVGFTKEYGKFVRSLETNQPGEANFPPLLKFLVNLLMGGVRPIEEQEEALVAASKEHEKNWDMIATQREIMNRDDAADPVQSIDEISVHTRIRDIETSNTEHLSVSGWYDSGSALGAVRYYLSALRSWDPASGKRHPRLLLGPWNHGARNNSSPFAKSDKPNFPLVAELLRFFGGGAPFSSKDVGEASGVDSSDAIVEGGDDVFPVHYFTVGEEVWKGAHVWPPPHRNHRLNLAEGYTLITVDPSEHSAGTPRGALSMQEELELEEATMSLDSTTREGKTEWEVDIESTTGVVSRWNLVQHMFKKPIVYADRAQQDKHNLLFDSAALSADLEVTGHPSVTLYVHVDTPDSAVFVYLEEVFPNGRVVYVTEGQLRLAHRAMGTEEPIYASCIPYRSFLKKDCELLYGSPVRAIIPFFPISYRFSKGSRLRLSIACFDSDNFDPLDGDQPTKLTVFHDMSYINLTVVDQ